MSRAVILDNFLDTPAPPEAGGTAALTEAERTAAYENGYQSGWDDAARADAADQLRIGAELAQSVQDLSFTYFEARRQILDGLAPFFTELVSGFLPEVAKAALPAVFEEHVRPIIEAASGDTVSVVVSASDFKAIQQVIAQENLGTVELTEEASAPPGRLYIRTPRSETRIDLDAALTALRRHISDFQTLNMQAVANG